MMNEDQNDQVIVRKCGVFSAGAWLVQTRQKQNGLTERKQGNQGFVEAPKESSEEIRSGSPEGSRPTPGGTHDRSKPIDFPGHEVVAQFLAAPELTREFDSFAAIAKHFNVSRMTVYRWAHDVDVLRRAYWLSMRNKITGDIYIRREWAGIVKKAVEMAKGGNVAAMKFLKDCAWGKDQESEESNSMGPTISELIRKSRERESEQDLPTWALRMTQGPESPESEVPEGNHPLEESEDKPE